MIEIPPEPPKDSLESLAVNMVSKLATVKLKQGQYDTVATNEQQLWLSIAHNVYVMDLYNYNRGVKYGD